AAGGGPQNRERHLRLRGDREALARPPLGPADAGGARRVRPALRRPPRALLHLQDRALRRGKDRLYGGDDRRRRRDRQDEDHDQAGDGDSGGLPDAPARRQMARLRRHHRRRQPRRQLPRPVQQDHHHLVLRGARQVDEGQAGRILRGREAEADLAALTASRRTTGADFDRLRVPRADPCATLARAVNSASRVRLGTSPKRDPGAAFGPRAAPATTADSANIVRETRTHIVVNFLPVGSEMATKWYVEQVLDAGCAFVNCIPVFIAREAYWRRRFEERGLPVVGDDVKSQVGATIVHRVLTRLFMDRGVRVERTSQLNFGGNTDFFNMLERERLVSKK